eukprot:GFUD01136764.1.p1 GENE.GFUD01136764.1~~GFUD01136764.1.p1  ORF type:complete len:372 (+),score=81.69 GFUD01136764.1:131-1246(+)
MNNTFSTAILYKDGRGVPIVQPLKSDPELDDDILNFFKCYKCYDLLPASTKLVVLDTELVLKKAFYAIVDTGVRACPLWDSSKQAYVGMLTITDFIRILQMNYKGPNIEMEAFEEQKLLDWKGITEPTKDLIHVSLDAGLLEAVTLLIENKIHRLPITDPDNGNVLGILNQKPLLKFLFNVPKLRNSDDLNRSIALAGVGSYGNITVAEESTKVIEALHKFVNDNVSALPIVSSDGRLTNIYTKFDVINLAATKSYSDLEITLKEATEHKIHFDGVHCCKGSESLLVVMERLVRADVNRLVIVDDDKKVVGIVTVSDFIHFLVLRHSSTTPSNRNRRASKISQDNGPSYENVKPLNRSSSTDSLPPVWFQV